MKLSSLSPGKSLTLVLDAYEMRPCRSNASMKKMGGYKLHAIIGIQRRDFPKITPRSVRDDDVIISIELGSVWNNCFEVVVFGVHVSINQHARKLCACQVVCVHFSFHALFSFYHRHGRGFNVDSVGKAIVAHRGIPFTREQLVYL